MSQLLLYVLIGCCRFSGYIDTLFLITHTSTFNVSLQALRLLLQISSTLSTASTATSPAPSSSKTAASSISDRYYRALYASLLDSRLNSTNKRAMYLNLLFKSLKEDKDPRKSGRTKAFVKRFLQLLIGAGDGNAEFVAGGLYLLGEVRKRLKVTPWSILKRTCSFSRWKRTCVAC